MTTIDSIPDSELEAAIAELQTPLVLTLHLSANEKQRLQRVALDSGLSEDAYVLGLIQEQLNQRVGAPTIHSATKHAIKVTGPSGSVTRG
jgi:hypothetical protein